MRLGATPPLYIPSCDPFPEPFSNSVGIKLLVWLHLEVALFVPFKPTHACTHNISIWILAQCHCTPVLIICFAGWMGEWKNETNSAALAQEITISPPCRPVDTSRRQPPVFSTIFHGKFRFSHGVLPCVHPILIIMYLPPETFPFRLPVYVHNLPVHHP